MDSWLKRQTVIVSQFERLYVPGVSPSDKDVGHTGLGFTRTNSFYLNPLFKGPNSKYSHIPRYTVQFLAPALHL